MKKKNITDIKLSKIVRQCYSKNKAIMSDKFNHVRDSTPEKLHC